MRGKSHLPVHVWFRRLLALVLLAGLISSGYGAFAVNDRRTGEPIVNWLQGGVVVPAGGVRWTWGVSGMAESRPDMWHFDVTFQANQSLTARLFWNGNETILYSRTGHQFEDSFELLLPDTVVRWRMDWQVANPNPTNASILNFTVHHYSVAFPHRGEGFATLALGLVAIAASSVVMIMGGWGRASKFLAKQGYRANR